MTECTVNVDIIYLCIHLYDYKQMFVVICIIYCCIQSVLKL